MNTGSKFLQRDGEGYSLAVRFVGAKISVYKTGFMLGGL